MKQLTELYNEVTGKTIKGFNKHPIAVDRVAQVLARRDSAVSTSDEAPVAAGDGCGAELQSWLKRPTVLPDASRDKPNFRRPVLPSSCTAVLDHPARVPAGGR
jgi:murein endopeptidase